MRTMKSKIIMMVFCLASVSSLYGKTISLAGEWSLALDPENKGQEQGWHAALPLGCGSLKLPGTLQEQGYGNIPNFETKWIAKRVIKQNFPNYFVHPMYSRYREDAHFRFPYLLNPERHYVGPAWYQRTVTIPESWKGQRMSLFLERCHWQSSLWVDGKAVGTNDAMGMPHIYDLSSLKPGKHTLTIRMDNSMLFNLGIDAHSISDQTQSAWNGIIGRMELQCSAPVFIEDVKIVPDVAKRQARMTVIIGDQTKKPGSGTLTAVVSHKGKTVLKKEFPAKWAANGGEQEVVLELGKKAVLWDEFNPHVYDVAVSLKNKKMSVDYATSFGLREIKRSGNRLLLNGSPIFLRGTLECCVFPLTGYPPTDLESWLKIMRKAKEYGLNHLRFHSWCPPRAAFQAADLEGVYLQPEVSMWAGLTEEEKFQWALAESKRMLETYGNHPSFLLMALGNEMHAEPEYLAEMLGTWQQDNRRIYSGGCNYNRALKDKAVGEKYDFFVGVKGYSAKLKTTDSARYLAAGKNYFITRPPQTTIDWREVISSFNMPFISHETVQRASYPDPAWQAKYTGSFQPAYLAIAKDQLAERGMLDQVPDFVEHSGRWQVQQFKEEIEASLRTPNMAGFQMLGLQDFPGQGTALVGVLDAFWEDKGYVTGKEFRRFCAPTVPLARMEKRIWSPNETFEATVEVTHYGAEPIPNAKVEVQVLGPDKKVLFSEQLTKAVSIGGAIPLTTISVPLSKYTAPAKYKLVVRVDAHENDWDFWVYPQSLPAEKKGDVYITPVMDKRAMDRLQSGGTVLLLPKLQLLNGNLPQCFTSTYWCTVYASRAAQTMGQICDPNHPLFAHFPTDKTTNWNWHELLVTARPMILDEWEMEHAWPKTYRPLIQPVNDWNTNYKLALLAEARVGNGRLIVCSMDLTSDLDTRPVARQFRYSLLQYMNSDAFDPDTEITLDQLNALYLVKAVEKKQ
ncbi:Beta-galactosidase [Pontiella desulfatans]|uniref:beta-galactosidase n=1 Tax=Pontiella desulfatans TaxID=2750659 RepID=A0A6C2U1V7_PONDE|nr:sugar-binding domain-containing protein [Pontiella desulfatans]VGO13571.1 Beta-galactosidase [Pontiella desulfatans]